MKRGGITIKKRRVSALLRDVDAGKFAIPHLQREFVWDGPKAAKLLDSILRGMPVGVVLVWETPKSQRLHLRQKYHVLPPFNSHNGKVWFLIDGQQRISVLYHVCKGDELQNAKRRHIDFSRVVLALADQDDGQQIRYRRPVDGEYVSLSVILHPQWRQKLNGLGKRKIERVRDCRERVLRYPMHAMFVKADLSEIRECFLRINTQGMKVTTADAIFTRAESLKLRDIVHEVREHLDESFKDIREEPILFALSAIRGGTEARGQVVESTIRKLDKAAKSDARLRKSLARDWNWLGPCIGKAADYLRSQFCVLSREYLASDYMLSMLGCFYYWNGHGPSRSQAEQIRKWFWATSVGSRYSGRDFNRCVPADLKYFKKLVNTPRFPFRYKPQVERVDVRKTQYAAATAITSAVYCMLLRRGPVYLFGNGINPIPIDRYSTRANRKDRHHIFPRQPLIGDDIPPKLYNSIANICLLVAEENQQVGSQRPRNYLRDLEERYNGFSRKMRRHLIPVDDDSGVWIGNTGRGFRKFLEQRTLLLCDALEEEAGIRLFRREGSR
ncbi:MAG: DUF262 domain-containing protein [Phycisphaeraceae bacterium]|nr:DUF262 domain-containing protein [Phycisphaeraceae bacterium]